MGHMVLYYRFLTAKTWTNCPESFWNMFLVCVGKIAVMKWYSTSFDSCYLISHCIHHVCCFQCKQSEKNVNCNDFVLKFGLFILIASFGRFLLSIQLVNQNHSQRCHTVLIIASCFFDSITFIFSTKLINS